MQTKADTFRNLHMGGGAFVMPNPWDIGSARILASMGYEALATTSSGMAHRLGRPEGTVPSEQMLEHCREIVAATPLPVSADLEKGIGDSPQSVAETIRLAAGTGLAGGSIEDHTGRHDDPIYGYSLAVERVAAAVEACRALPEDFVLTARCESLLWGKTDLDDVIRRLQAYEAAGADVLYAPGLDDLAAIRTVCSALGKPVNVVMEMPGAVFSIADLADAGVTRISIGSGFFRVAYGAFIDAAREVKDQGTFGRAGRGIDFAELEEIFKLG